jgi:glucose-6-phosphate isomerase, archaeal
MKSRLIEFDTKTGLSPEAKPIQRRISQMRGMFVDEQARVRLESSEDPVVYEFYDMQIPERQGEVAFGTSIVYPGIVGNEYYMTKGHFHAALDTAEVYLCLRGRGYLLMESPEGEVEARELKPGTAVYVPGRYAHRSINSSTSEPLVTFFSFPAEAGHDYGSIERTGFRKVLIERDGRPELVDNPKRSAT